MIAVIRPERRNKCSLFHYKRRTFTRKQVFLQFIKIIAESFFCCVGIQDLPWNAEKLQLSEGNFPLLNVLRLILHPGFPPPADCQQARETVYTRIHQGCQRIHGIPQSAVLHIAQSRLSRCQIMTRAQTNRAAFIMRNNMMDAFGSEPAVQFITQAFQE